MMHHITLYTQFKNTDLHAVSATDVIKQLIPDYSLKSVKRFGRWVISLEAETPALAAEQVTTILSMSYYLANPHKETVYFEGFPKDANSDDQLFLFGVSDKDRSDYTDVKQKIKQKCGVTVAELSHTLIWKLTLANTNKTYESVLKDLEKKVVFTTSRRQGLLVNPLYQTIEVLS